ncbi:MAG TPA: laccase domain-containing protein, partial [Lachnoclostridium phytofermentans]|nr:laccase domain-containing protein [Lachnoclostridium phytofermentans]
MSEIKLTEHAVLKNVGGVPYVSFPILEQFPYVRHGFSTRLGGVSSGIFESMNLGFRRGDYEDLVMENYERICHSIG